MQPQVCMQSHPLKSILSSRSCSMQSVFRHHICWVSHIPVKHEKSSPLVFALPLLLSSLQPLFCFWLKSSELQWHLNYPRHCSGIYRQTQHRTSPPTQLGVFICRCHLMVYNTSACIKQPKNIKGHSVDEQVKLQLRQVGSWSEFF